MTTFQQAHATVERLLAERTGQTRIDLLLDEEATGEEPWCWVFYYNSRAYLETGMISHALAGNGPIVVDKDFGTVHELATARPTEEQLEELRRAR
jgi:hypothetical protein